MGSDQIVLEREQGKRILPSTPSKNWPWGLATLMAKAPCPRPGANGSLQAHKDPENRKGGLERRPQETINPSFLSSATPALIRVPGSAHRVRGAHSLLSCCRSLPKVPNPS